MRYVKFTPEEMAYEPPADMSDPEKYPTIAVGRREWLRFLSFKRGYARLDPDLREAFPDDRAVNAALRHVKQLTEEFAARKRESEKPAKPRASVPARRKKAA